jgi:Tol biopolymer transport system component
MGDDHLAGYRQSNFNQGRMVRSIQYITLAQRAKKMLIRGLLSLFTISSLAACSSTTVQPPAPSQTVLAPPAVTTIPQATALPTAPVPEIIPSISQYGLAGRLVLIQYHPDGNRLIELDLSSGEIKTLFQAPGNSWLAEAAVSPDGGQILLTYAPPPPGGKPQFGYSDLYLLPYSSPSQLTPFLTRSDPQESYFFPAWAPDGQSVYFTHLYRIDPNSQVPAYQNNIEMVSLSGEQKTVVEHALWPAISPDGAKLSYLTADPVTLGNDLYLANTDGTAQAPVLQPGVNPPIDAHVFTIDGSQLIFSMVNPLPAPTSSWLEELLGVKVASAHSVPSDWYRVPISGGEPERLTNLDDVNLNGSLSPDGSKMAFISATGLFVMNVDGSNLTHLAREVLDGSVDWIP